MFYSAVGSRLDSVLTWDPDRVGSGGAFSSERAAASAYGEAVERYAGGYPCEDVERASQRELHDRGERYIPLTQFAPFSAEQYADPGFRYGQPDPDAPLDWVAAADLLDGARVMVPADAVVLNYRRHAHVSAETLYPVPVGGIAAHRDRSAAVRAGMLEVIERDSVSMWWIGGVPAQEIDGEELLDAMPWLAEGRDPAIRLRWHLMKAPAATFVVGCTLWDETHEVLGIGFAARDSLDAAVEKATVEAFQLRRLSLAMLDPDSWIWRTGLFSLAPFRADRQYARSFAEDFRDMTQLIHNSQFYLDPSAIALALARIEEITEGEIRTREARRASSWSAQEVLREAGWRGSTVPLTTTDVEALGYEVVRVVCADAVLNQPAAFPPLGHPRIARVTSRPCVLPLPHS